MKATPMKKSPIGKTYVDRTSGVEVTQLTGHKGHSHHFYFTNPGWYAQGRKLLFASDRSGSGNVYRVPLVAFDSLPLADP